MTRPTKHFTSVGGSCVIGCFPTPGTFLTYTSPLLLSSVRKWPWSESNKETQRFSSEVNLQQNKNVCVLWLPGSTDCLVFVKYLFEMCSGATEESLQVSISVFASLGGENEFLPLLIRFWPLIASSRTDSLGQPYLLRTATPSQKLLIFSSACQSLGKQACLITWKYTQAVHIVHSQQTLPLVILFTDYMHGHTQ